MYKDIIQHTRRPKLKHFRSLWGLEGSNWEELLPKLKQQGFDGIEASLTDIKWPDLDKFVQLAKLNKTEFICGLYTSWDDYNTPWERKPVKEHLQQLEQQFQCALHLRSMLQEQFCRINVHSGSDDFTIEESIDFFGEGTR